MTADRVIAGVLLVVLALFVSDLVATVRRGKRTTNVAAFTALVIVFLWLPIVGTVLMIGGRLLPHGMAGDVCWCVGMFLAVVPCSIRAFVANRKATSDKPL